MPTSKRKKKPQVRSKRHRSLGSMSDDELLDTRLCDLNVRIAGALKRRIARLYDELEARGIRHRPHVWLSSEWFSPDGVPGIALPFYLAHERLMRLEQKMMLEVEGGGERSCMRILRHEAGHAICTAYRLHFKRRWQKVFGRFSKPYPISYKPDPLSKKYVVHFDAWYAQAHPAEDFAETFAVWLRPGSRWRQTYKTWPALKKLEFVDELMAEIADQVPPVRTKQQVEPLRELRTTLREHYKRKQRRYAEDWPEFYDQHLRRLFSADARYASHETAASFLRRTRPEIREAVSRWTGEHPYTVDQVLRDMIDRCKELKLRLAQPQRETKIQTMLMVAVQTMNYLHGGHNRFAI